MKKITLLLLVFAVGCGKSKREKRKEWLKSKRDTMEIQMKDSVDAKLEILGQDSVVYVN